MGRSLLGALGFFSLNVLFYCGYAQDVILTVEPNWSTVFTGESVTFTCDTKGEKGDDWFYKINKDDQEITQYDKKENQTVQLQVPGHSGEYQCDANTRGSTIKSNKVSLTVSDKDVILETPASAVFQGEPVTLRCRHRDPSNIENAVFYRDGSPVEVDTNHQPQMMKNTIQVMSNGSSYTCKFGDKESEPIRPKVEPKPKAQLSRDIPVGGRVTLTCSVRSSSGWKFFWYRGDKTSEPLTSQDAVFLSNGQISVPQGGFYWCRGGRGEPVYYTEYSDSVVTNRAVVSLQPNWPEIYSGETITLTCDIEDGGDTEWEYEWLTSSSTNRPKTKEFTITASHSESYTCRGRPKGGESKTEWSETFEFKLSTNKPKAVLTVSPWWPSPGDSVTLNCSVEHPSAGWRFSWYKAVPKPAERSYSYELLPDSTTGTEQDSYSVHGQTHTAGYVCRAARGDPVYHTDDSELKFVWSGDSRPSASLSVSPDRVQHFTRESLSLSCEGNSAEWTVRKFTNGYLTHCSLWGTMIGSTCKIDRSWLSGVYWCESATGQFSNVVNITIDYGHILLMSPVRPVTEGQAVTLGCKLKKQNYTHNVVFYKNGKIIQNTTRVELIISAVSKSDEGFYKCKGDHLVGGWSETSKESWMSVKSSRPGPEPDVVIFVWPLVLLIILLLLFLFLFLLLCCYKMSKASCFNSSQRTNQGPATDQDGDPYSSLSHGDLSLYETMRRPGEYENASQFNRSQRTNQGPATDQDGDQYASLSHGDLSLYETMRRPGEYENVNLEASSDQSATTPSRNPFSQPSSAHLH